MAIAAQTDYELGRDNIQFLGLDIHNPVFVVSSLTIVAFVAGVLAFRDAAVGVLSRPGRGGMGLVRPRHRDVSRNVPTSSVAQSTADPLQPPPLRFEQPAELLSANGPHTAISMILSASETGTSRTSTERHPSTAS